MNPTLAIFLAHRYADAQEATRPKDRAVFDAKFVGAAGAAHALGVGMTPAMVELWVIEAYRLHGPRPRVTTSNQERKAWIACVSDAILASANAAGYGASTGGR